MRTYERTKGVILSDRPRKAWTPKKKSKKPYAIQFRYPKQEGFMSFIWDGNWHTFSRYETRKRREQAMEQLRKGGHHGYDSRREFRAVDLEGAAQ